MNSPHVLSFSANDVTGKTARFTVGTDIIDYMESSRTFGREDLSDPNADGRFQRRMVAIPDKKGAVVTPMVLTISNKNDLYLVRKDDESKSGDGWKLIEVSSAFKGVLGDNLRVRAHAAGWTEDDRITIAVAVDDGSSERSRVFVAYDLSSRTSDWENISWIDCGSREDIRVEGIRVLDGGDGVWTIVLAGDRGPNDTLYLLRSNTQRSFAQALVFTTAVTLEEILDFEVAVHPLLGSGIAVLGTSVGKRDLSFRPFPSYKPDGSFDSIPPVEAFPCPAGANVLESGLTKQVQKGRRRTYFGTDIYVGGQGVHQIRAFDILQVGINGGTLDPIVVASPDIAPNVQDLIVGDVGDGTMSVWALLQNGDLNVVRKPAAAQEWGNPLRLRVGVQAIAPVHGDEHLTTSLLMVYANGNAAFLCRDEGQGVWQERPLAVANPEEVTKVTCYGTTLRVLGEGSIPTPEIKVKVSASVLSSVVLNGNAVFIGPGISFETETDANGAVSLFDRVKSFTPAIYRFEIDGFEQCIDVNPANGVHERFKSITADELRTATISTPEGEVPLLPESFRMGADSSQVDIVAASLNQVATLANSASGVVAGVSETHADQAFSSKLRTEVVPDGYRWGIQVDSNGSVKIVEGSLIDQILDAVENPGEFFKNLGEGISDFFEGLFQKAKAGITFVIQKVKKAAKEVFEFVCAIGNQIKRFVIDSLEKAGNFFEWLWEQVKTGLEAAWEYLKFLFDWQDILRMRDLIVDGVDEFILLLKNSNNYIKNAIEKGFDFILAELEKWDADAASTGKVDKPTSENSFLNTLRNATEPIQDVIDKMTGNSAVTWVTEQVNSLLDEIIEIETPGDSQNFLDSLSSFLEDTLFAVMNEAWSLFENIQTDIVEFLGEGGTPNLKDLSFETLKNLFISAGLDTLKGLIRVVKRLILAVFDVMELLADLVRDILFTKIRFPFIEKLVKLVTGGLVSVDTSFSLVESITLPLAVISTIISKLILGKSPFQGGNTIVFDHQAIVVQSATSGREVAGIINYGCSLLALIFTGISVKLYQPIAQGYEVLEGEPRYLVFGRIPATVGKLEIFAFLIEFVALVTGSFSIDPEELEKDRMAQAMIGLNSANLFLALLAYYYKLSEQDKWETRCMQGISAITLISLLVTIVDYSIKLSHVDSSDAASEGTGFAGSSLGGVGASFACAGAFSKKAEKLSLYLGAGFQACGFAADTAALIIDLV